MKIDFIKMIIGLAVSALIAYGFYAFNENANNELLVFGSLFFLAITLVVMMGVSFELPRTSALIRTVSGIFFVIALLSNMVFAFIDFKSATYIIINGILFLIYGLIAYSLAQAKQ